jgi:phenylacetic acid degradation operon negative regulatory protein
MVIPGSGQNAPSGLLDADSAPFARDLMVTLFGFVWRNQEDYLPSAGLVELMGGFGISPANARATLSRMSKDGILELRKSGRYTLYRISDETVNRVESGTRRVLSFGASDTWDGQWTVVAFSIPEEHREIRTTFRTRLRFEGFAPYYDAMWIAPGHRTDGVLAQIHTLGVDNAAVFTIPDQGMDVVGRKPLDSWDLEPVGERYAELKERADVLHGLVMRGDLNPASALRQRTELLISFRRVVRLDPELPMHMMPDGWPRLVARAAFIQAFDELALVAAIRVRQVFQRYDPELGEKMGRITVTPFNELGRVSPSRATVSA